MTLNPQIGAGPQIKGTKTAASATATSMTRLATYFRLIASHVTALNIRLLLRTGLSCRTIRVRERG